MSAARTPAEIAAEIAALKALKPIGRWAAKTANSIRISIDALNGCIDETSDEFTVEMSEDDQMTAMDAITWMNGGNDDKPSEGWEGFVEGGAAINPEHIVRPVVSVTSQPV